MIEKTVKCPMCGLSKETDCSLMVGKSGDSTQACCCERLQKGNVKK